MSHQTPPGRAGTPSAPQSRRDPHGWPHAVLAVLASLVAMAVVAGLGLWAAGAGDLPDGAFPAVVAAVVVMAVGGSVGLSGGAGGIADTDAGLSVVPLSVSLVGALVIAAGFLRPLRHRAVADTKELLGWAARIALLWVLLLVGLGPVAGHRFTIELGEGTAADIGDLLGASPKVGFETDVLPTVVFGLLWLAGVFAMALLVSRGAPLPARLVRFQESVRPAAYAMLVLLLAYVALGLVIGVIVAATQGHTAETLAVLLLGLPNLLWLAFTLGLGASWEGRVDGPFGLPMPRVLDQVLRTPSDSTLNLRTLSDHDDRVWLLLVVAAVMVLGAAFVMAARSPARMRPWQHAVHMAVALALTVFTVCLLAGVSAHAGLSLLGIGDLGGGLTGLVKLRPHLGTAVLLAVAWGLVAGFIGGLLTRPVHRRGEVGAEEP
ncbi:streptophobe family protein [Streptomyces alboflavus]|uniref:streptophobe family protein n=1 Tax=Streptomyces alboflavus TaxID=67267 RepID=UPI000B4290FD|nr:streptophobe family protein [Streptomyces alboflavus]